MNIFEIWSEEITFNGSYVPVMCHGEVKAETFREACIELSRVKPKFREDYEVNSNTWYGARLFKSQIDAIKNENYTKTKDVKVEIVPYESVLDEIEENPQILISALTRLIYEDVEEMPDYLNNKEAEMLKRKLKVADDEIKFLKEQIKKEKEGRKKLSDVLRSYSNDNIDEAVAYGKARVFNAEHELMYYKAENKRLEQAVKTLSKGVN